MKILIIDRFPEDFVMTLKDKGAQVHYFPGRNRAEILSQLPDYHILIMNSRIRLDREAIDHASKLELVIRAGVGMDHIDMDYLRDKGIGVKNTKGGNADSVGEHMVGMLLAMRHHLYRADREVRSFTWKREENRGQELGGKTIGLIGYGFTGKAVARKLSGFGLEVLASDKYLHNYGDTFAKEASPDEIKERSEILSLHIPLTEETHHWVDFEFFSSFQKSIHFLNLSRGPIVDIRGLIDALEEGRVRAAALDVLPNEKLHDLDKNEKALYEELFSRENVFLSPHIGGWSHESLRNINQMILNFVEEKMGNSAG